MVNIDYHSSSQAEIDAIGESLPIRDFTFRHGEYGSLKVLADYCGLLRPPTKFRGEWQHGWHPEFHNFNPELVIGSTGITRKKKKKIYLVSRDDQRVYLEAQGYKRVHSIGLPIVYVKRPVVNRIKKSLLVMPFHTLEYTKNSLKFMDYVDYIKSVSSGFELIVACIHPSCIAKGYWIPEFKSCGIPVISGASILDNNSLYRVAHLMSKFEYVTSNRIGSLHIYAQFFGAKASVSGPLSRVSMEEFQGDPFYQLCPELVDFHLHREEDLFRGHYSDLFCDPQVAACSVKKANSQLGMECIKSPDEIRRLMGWTGLKTFISAFRTKIFYGQYTL